MGYLSAQAMAQATNLSTALHWHLTTNHFPPVPASMVGPCMEAIEAIQEDDSERMIDLPEGVFWRDQTSAPAWAVVEGHHLEAFIDIYEDGVDYEEPEELDDLDPSAVYNIRTDTGVVAHTFVFGIEAANILAANPGWTAEFQSLATTTTEEE